MISIQPMKLINFDIVSNKIAFWKYSSILKNQHLKITQFDEFSVGRDTHANKFGIIMTNMDILFKKLLLQDFQSYLKYETPISSS